MNGERKVALSGEAYFEVKKHPGKKFIVNTSDISIRVLGTKFNVKAYPDEETIKTTLVEGSISILNLKGDKKDKETYSERQIKLRFTIRIQKKETRRQRELLNP